MRLRVATPTALVVDDGDVACVQAEDETGSFGIRPGHADFLTVLATSVLTWRDGMDREHHVAVRGGVFSVRDGRTVEVATRDAVGEADLARLGPAVLQRLRADAEAEAAARLSAARLQTATLHRLQRYLRTGQAGADAGPRSDGFPRQTPGAADAQG